MNGQLVWLVLLALPLLTVVGLVAVLVATSRTPRTDVPSTVAAARQHAAVVSGIAWAVLLAALVLGGPLLTPWFRVLNQGLVLGLVPAIAGLLFASTHATGEITWPRPSGQIRRAALVRRTVTDVAPGWLRRTTWGWAALVALALVTSGLAPGGGRVLTRTFEGGGASAGPFPGWFYGVPLLIATAVVLGATEGALHLVARRPAIMDAAPAWDLGLRRLSAHRVLRGAQLVLGLTTGAVLAVAGHAVQSIAQDRLDTEAAGSRPLAALGIALTVLGIAAVLAALAVTLVPAPAPIAPPFPQAPVGVGVAAPSSGAPGSAASAPVDGRGPGVQR